MSKQNHNHSPPADYNALIEQLFCDTIVAQHAGKLTGLIYIIISLQDDNSTGEQSVRQLNKLANDKYMLYQLKDNHYGYLARQLESPDQAAHFCKSLIDDNNTECKLSIGITIYPGAANSPDALIQNARRAALKSTRHNSDHYRFYRSHVDATVTRNIRLEKDLKSALEKNQFFLHYQPQYDLKTLKIVKVEALLRWKHPEFDLVSPLVFIPIAEKQNLIIDIGEWVLKTACQEYKQWGLDQSIKLAINVSPKQLQSYYFVDHVESIITKNNIDPHCIELELTENSYIHDFESSLEKLRALAKLNINITIDDYGTGYSTLHYLKKLPINSLKIDKSYIDNLTQSKAEQIIVKSTIDMAHELGLVVTAEGIETQEQLMLLKEMGCDIGQGYLFSRPLDNNAIFKYTERGMK